MIEVENILNLLMFLALPMLGGFYLVAGIRGLVTGGPRRDKAPDSPKLYDRTYFALRICLSVAIITLGAVFWFVFEHNIFGDPADVFSKAIGLFLSAFSLPMLVRGDMMNRAAKCLARNGTWSTRWAHYLYYLRYEYWGARRSKLAAAVTLVFGTAFLVFGSRFFEFARVAGVVIDQSIKGLIQA